jgi:hypothetical protein
MMQRNYYALVAGLPDIVPEDKKIVLYLCAIKGDASGRGSP